MAAELQDYYNTGEDGFGGVVRPTNWRAQTFTTSLPYSIESVKLFLYRMVAGSDGVITVSIREVDVETGKPTGVDKASATFNRDTLTTNTAGEWKVITFGAAYSLAPATQYAIVVGPAVGTGDTYWRDDTTGDPYSDGKHTYSVDAGSTWGTPSTNSDYLFETWGTGGPIKAKTPAPTIGATGMTLDYQEFTWVSGSETPPDEEVYNVYWGTVSGELSLIIEEGSATSIAAAFLIATIGAGLYNETYYWRVDTYWPSTEETADGDEWSFSSIIFDPPLPTGVTLDAEGEPTGTPTGESGMMAVRRLVAVANNKIWIEDV